MNSQWILTVLIFTKIHIGKTHFTFAARISFFDLRSQKLSHVCSDFNILELSIFRMLLWPTGECQILTASTCVLSVFLQNVAVALRRLNISMYATLHLPLLPSKSFKHDKEFHQNWSPSSFVLGVHIHLN